MDNVKLESIKDLLKIIKNPNSERSLIEEDRLTKLIWDEGFLHIQYRRDGISPEQKREIEKSIILALKGSVPAEKIKIFTISDRSEDVFKNIQKTDSTPVDKPKNPGSPAQLQVGHGAIGNKKSVPGVKHLIAVGSGKGGVGKSTVAVNIALALAAKGNKVGLLDADVYGPSVPMLLNQRAAKPLANDQKKILPVDAYGIKFISFGLFIEENNPVIWRGPMLGGVLNQFLFDVEWGDTDFLIVDLPPGTGDIQLSMIQNTKLDGVVIVSTPQDLALLDAVKGLEMFRKMQIPIIGLVENMSYFICDQCDKKHFIFGEGGVEKKSRELDVPLLGKIGLDPSMRKGSDSGVPFMSVRQNDTSFIGKTYFEIANQIVKRFNQ
ncbi:MAG: Mrp/NBP35 family ATP-binding protein [Bacteriovoracaceae bacterium]|nr:Mrp/NBP35 family ATP-binding protein [Bacteriovoracaceae bacterium]